MSSEGESVHCHILIPSVQRTVTLPNELKCKTVLVCFIPINSAFNYIHLLTNRIDFVDLCWRRPISTTTTVWNYLKSLSLLDLCIITCFGRECPLRYTSHFICPVTGAYLAITALHNISARVESMKTQTNSLLYVVTTATQPTSLSSLCILHLSLPEWLCGIASWILLLTWLQLVGCSILYMNLSVDHSWSRCPNALF